MAIAFNDRSPMGEPTTGGGPFRVLPPGRMTQIRLIDADGGNDRLLHEAAEVLEAPNWTPAGDAVIVNGGGRLFSVDLESGAIASIVLDDLTDVNNDHLLSADGCFHLLSAGGGIYRAPYGGGPADRLSPDGSTAYFLHGLSPDGRTLCCTTKDATRSGGLWGIELLPFGGGPSTTILLSHSPVDGPEWSTDGQWIWFNGELAATRPGHSQIFRMRPDGTNVERMHYSPTVDWFPHFRSNGSEVAFLSYEPGVEGHPANLPVTISTLPVDGGEATELVSLFGGQGSMNVNSWSPDGTVLAYISYPEITYGLEQERRGA